MRLATGQTERSRLLSRAVRKKWPEAKGNRRAGGLLAGLELELIENQCLNRSSGE
jgi:hypothetical protein